MDWHAIRGLAKSNDGHGLTILNVENGLPANNVTGFDQDSKGNIWIGTWGGGISKFDGKTIETIGRTNGLFETRVTHSCR
ncbi:MAG: hypothetical protein IPG07_19800 [Crocinitomicaceae bacterium]|nr:hypothetical protein [Crocinitomicaceae bacterium]